MLKRAELIDHKRQQNELDFHNSIRWSTLSTNNTPPPFTHDQFKKVQYAN